MTAIKVMPEDTRAHRSSAALVAIRCVEPGDWPGLWPLLRAMGGTDSADATQQRFREVTERRDHYIPVAFIGAELVGYA